METSPLVALLYSTLIKTLLQQPEVTRGQPEAMLVSVSSGQLRGENRVLPNGQVVYEFKGIPYAQPPVGDLRFAPPQPPLPWSGVKDASRHGNHCPQNETLGVLTNASTGMSEDCLYLNIYSPVPVPTFPLPSSSMLPVIVWVHGGGFYVGTGSDYDGASLATRGRVIVVTLNYRLGALGFLSTEDDVIAGNFGLLDQVMALKWVRLNIRHFGGDPGQVTVAGQSAGGHSVSLLSLSPLATGLFQRAIPQSGAAITPTSVYRESEIVSPTEISGQLADKLGCSQAKLANSTSLLTCLRSKLEEEILKADLEMIEEVRSNVTIIWKPRVDGSERFLPEDPELLLSLGMLNDVDTMHGYCANQISVFVKDPENDGVTLEECKEALVSFTGLANYRVNETEIVERVLDKFFRGVTSPTERRSRLIDVLSDLQMAAPILHEIDTWVTSASVSSSKRHFLYQFSYRGSLFPDRPQWQGFAHGADLMFVFGFPPDLSTFFLQGQDPTASDMNVSEMVMDMWSNFAKYGHPTQHSPSQTSGHSWPEYSPGQRLVLDITENLAVRTVDWAFKDAVYQLINSKL